MITQFIRALMGKPATGKPPTGKTPTGKPPAKNKANKASPATQYKAKRLGVDSSNISRAAYSVAQTLQNKGFAGLIVGGAVRDLMLGMRPKDFDIATNATPEEVKRLFRRAFIIGRRFRIVHVMVGGETIEVTTFRAAPQNQGQTQGQTQGQNRGQAQMTGRSGRVLDDNDFGSQSEDAARRDFTVNALYYDPVAEIIYDYFDGVADVKAKMLRMIGDPLTRYREDPVRILRALRFAAKLNFKLDHASETPIRGAAHLLKDVPEARLFMEFMKLVMSGQALACLQALHQYGLHRVLWRELAAIVDTPSAFVEAVLYATDQRVQNDQSVSPGFLLAGLCWDAFDQRWQALIAGGALPMPALHQAADEVFAQKLGQFGVQRKIESDMREIWDLQARLQKTTGKMPLRMVEHPRFRAGYDFLLLRAQSGNAPAELAQWWTDFYHGDEDARANLLQAIKKSSTTSTRRRRKKKAIAPLATSSAE